MNHQKRQKIRLCYIVAYKAPDYIRTRVLLKALADIQNLELYTAINTNRSVLRYLQTLWRLLLIRVRHHPDVYILGFRGQEVFWPVRLLTIGKPLIFDEFINPHDWLGEENNKLPGFLIKFADWYEKLALMSSRFVLTDTKLGAEKSKQTYRLPREKFRTVYVGADEELFKPRESVPNNQQLEIFFYGNMAPLHGLEVILETAELLKQEPIHFTIVGGKGKPDEIKQIRNFIQANNLKNVSHKEWSPFEEIPHVMASSDLFLGGPFGNTSQARRVVTGKTFQALAVGVPTIIGKTDEKIGFDDKRNCLLVDQGSARSLAEAIKWAVANKAALEGIGRNGRRLFESRFATAQVEKQLETIINEALIA